MRGRPQKHFDPDTILLFRKQGMTWQEICRILDVSYATLRTHGLLDGRTTASYRPGYKMIQEEVVNGTR